MPSTLTLTCPRCKKDFKAPKALKKWWRFRFDGKTFRQRVTVYCSLECLHD